MRWLSKFERWLGQQFWFLPPDLHERQRYIAKLIPPNKKILDVGGEKRILASRVRADDYVIVNIKKIGDTDLTYNGKDIPFKDEEFDIVVSIDVLEHVPKQDRINLISEMVRVAKERIIISAPLGTSTHILGEKKLHQWFEQQKITMPFLAEHLERGLPTPESITKWVERWSATLKYSGDFRVSNFLTRLHTKEVVKLPVLNHLLYFLKLGLNAIYNLCLYPFLINKNNYSATTNRFYLLINK